MREYALLGLLASSVTGCIVHGGGRGPGATDLHTAPAPSASQTTEAPPDQGEQLLVFRPGGYVLAGAAIPTGSGASQGSTRFGTEVSFALRDRKQSHTRYQHFPLDVVGIALADNEIALNIGWSFVDLNPGTEQATFGGPAYSELQWTSWTSVPSAVALGYFVNPRGFDAPEGYGHGVQMSASLATLFFRASYDITGEVAVLGGMVLKIPVIVATPN